MAGVTELIVQLKVAVTVAAKYAALVLNTKQLHSKTVTNMHFVVHLLTGKLSNWDNCKDGPQTKVYHPWYK